jgi:hypothetical protein
MVGVYVEPVGVGGGDDASFTQAGMPSASAVASGTVVYNTTYSVEMRSNGARWVPLAAFRIYANGGDVIVTNTTADTEVATFTIPAKLMGTGLLTFFADWGHTSSANSKQIKILFGGAPLIFVTGFASTTTVAGLYHIRNVTETSQVGTNPVAPGVGTSGGALAVSSVDTNNDVIVSVQFKMGALGETMTLKNLYVELHP